jgi:hypothetical protein
MKVLLHNVSDVGKQVFEAAVGSFISMNALSVNATGVTLASGASLSSCHTFEVEFVVSMPTSNLIADVVTQLDTLATSVPARITFMSRFLSMQRTSCNTSAALDVKTRPVAELISVRTVQPPRSSLDTQIKQQMSMTGITPQDFDEATPLLLAAFALQFQVHESQIQLQIVADRRRGLQSGINFILSVQVTAAQALSINAIAVALTQDAGDLRTSLQLLAAQSSANSSFVQIFSAMTVQCSPPQTIVPGSTQPAPALAPGPAPVTIQISGGTIALVAVGALVSMVFCLAVLKRKCFSKSAVIPLGVAPAPRGIASMPQASTIAAMPAVAVPVISGQMISAQQQQQQQQTKCVPQNVVVPMYEMKALRAGAVPGEGIAVPAPQNQSWHQERRDSGGGSTGLLPMPTVKAAPLPGAWHDEHDERVAEPRPPSPAWSVPGTAAPPEKSQISQML